MQVWVWLISGHWPAAASCARDAQKHLVKTETPHKPGEAPTPSLLCGDNFLQCFYFLTRFFWEGYSLSNKAFSVLTQSCYVSDIYVKNNYVFRHSFNSVLKTKLFSAYFFFLLVIRPFIFLRKDIFSSSICGCCYKQDLKHFIFNWFRSLQHAKSCLSLATPWTVAHQAHLSMGFPRQEHWRGLPFPPPFNRLLLLLLLLSHFSRVQLCVTP